MPTNMQDKGFVDYTTMQAANEVVFWDMVQKTMPDLYGILKEIKDSEVNPFILAKVARAMALIAGPHGTKYGKVTTTIENGTATFIYGEEANRINEPVIKKTRLP